MWRYDVGKWQGWEHWTSEFLGPLWPMKLNPRHLPRPQGTSHPLLNRLTLAILRPFLHKLAMILLSTHIDPSLIASRPIRNVSSKQLKQRNQMGSNMRSPAPKHAQDPAKSGSLGARERGWEWTPEVLDNRIGGLKLSGADSLLGGHSPQIQGVVCCLACWPIVLRVC